jgi:hypothetical protein
MQQVFSQWNRGSSSRAPAPAAAAAAAGSNAKIQGVLCTAPLGGSGSNVSLRLLPDQDDQPDSSLVDAALDESGPTIRVSIPRHATDVALLQPLDRVSVEGLYEVAGRGNGSVHLNGLKAHVATPMCDWVTDDMMATQHVRFPEGEDTLGAPFIIYSGQCSYEASPGLHRTAAELSDSSLTFTSKAGRESRRLTYQFVQRQWLTQAEFERGPEPTTMRVTLWDDACRELPGDGLTRDLSRWSAIMRAHAGICFYALVAVDTSYQFGGIVNLKALAVRWQLRPYLEQHGIVIPADVMERLVPRAMRQQEASRDIVNVSTEQARPTGPEWSYYALTADPVAITTVAALEKNTKVDAVFFAVRQLVANPAPVSPPPCSLESDEEVPRKKQRIKKK